MEQASIMTRIRVPDFDRWKPMFDQDGPGARRAAEGYRLYRAAADPNEVFIQVDFASLEEAETARERLVASGVLERFADRSGPTIVRCVEVVAGGEAVASGETA